PGVRTIIATYSAAGQFVAYFDDSPARGFDGDLPAGAVRRLLESENSAPGAYVFLCDTSPAESIRLCLEIEWSPPELLFPCLACECRGECFLEHAICSQCGGRRVIPV